MSRTNYTKAVAVVETLLGIKKIVTVTDAAIKMGAPQLTEPAANLVKR